MHLSMKVRALQFCTIQIVFLNFSIELVIVFVNTKLCCTHTWL